MKKYLPYLFLIGAFLIPFAVYLKTLAPTYIPIDAAEFTLCIHFWGVCHSPGFPFYVMLGRFFETIFPFGTVAFRANLLSAIWGAATVFLVYLTLNVLGVRRGFAFLLSLFLAFGSVFWEFSLAADVFSFSTFLIALSFLMLFKNRRNLAFFVLGLSASHFYISAVLAPVFCAYFGIIPLNLGEDRVKAKPFILAVLLFFVGFFPQIVMYARMLQGPEISWGHVHNLGGYIDYLRRKEFGSIFLIANPVLTFSFVKMAKQFFYFYKQLFFDFMVILPIISLTAFWQAAKLLKDKRIWTLIVSFFVLSSVQLFLLSTIDPGGADNPFQINKFYLTSFVVFVLFAGVVTQFLYEKIFGYEQSYLHIFMGILVFVVFISNLPSYNYSKNEFTENWVLDALGKVPQGAIVITVDHPFYFGGLYEQKINGRFKDLTLLYFPNDKNRDSEAYHPEVFAGLEDKAFFQKVAKGKSLGAAENYVLSTISKNLNRPIYVLQGSFEDSFFSFIKPQIEPLGLMWKVNKKEGIADPKVEAGQFMGFKNKSFQKDDFDLKQQAAEAQAYAISYFNAGHYMAVNGYFDEALSLFSKSLAVDPSAKSVSQEKDFVIKIKSEAANYNDFLKNKDMDNLNQLGSDYAKLGANGKAIEAFAAVVSIDPGDAKALNNLAFTYKENGQNEDAIKYYKQALAIDPSLDLAKQGLSDLESN